MTTLSERLKMARAHLGLNQEEMADAVGAKKRGYQDNESGKTTPGSNVIAGFAALGINANWLLTGEGEMVLASHRDYEQQQDIVHAVLNDDCAAYERSIERTLPKLRELVAYGQELQGRLRPLGDERARLWSVLFYDLVRDGKASKDDVEALLAAFSEAFADGVKKGEDKKAAEIRRALGISDQDNLSE